MVSMKYVKRIFLCMKIVADKVRLPVSDKSCYYGKFVGNKFVTFFKITKITKIKSIKLMNKYFTQYVS